VTLCSLLVGSFGFPPHGKHAVQTRTYDVPGLKASGEKKVKVYAPKDNGTYPFVTFAHGIIDNNYETLCSDIASYGFVVSNMLSCAPSLCNLDHFTQDQLYMLDFAEEQHKVSFKHISILQAEVLHRPKTPFSFKRT
jgi:hypothetical protein